MGTHTVFPVSGTAIEACEICFIDIDFFEASLKVDPNFLYKPMLFFADELQLSELKMPNLAHMSVKGRVAEALIGLQEKLAQSQKEL